jgi:hypothetical protein
LCLIEFWRNFGATLSVFTAPIFTSARVCGHLALARTPSEGTTHHTDDLAGSLGLSCVRGAPQDVTEDRRTSDRVQHGDHRNALDGNMLQKELVAMKQAQNGQNIPQVHQNCVRADLTAVRDHRWPLTPQSQLFKFAPEPFYGPV